MAKPTKYSEHTAEEICKNLAIGSTRKAAFGAAGISHGTFATWLHRYPAFLEAVTRAEAQAELLHTQRFYAAATEEGGDWRASESWLKRRRREEWGDYVNINLDKEIADLLAQLAGEREKETVR